MLNKKTSVIIKNYNKDIIQSYVITTAKYNFSIDEKRILYKIVELQQSLLKGKKLDNRIKIDFNLFNDAVIEIPLKQLLPDNSQNYSQMKAAFTSLRNKTIEISEETKEGEKWAILGIIEKPRFDTPGFVKFEIQPEIYDALLDFSKGWRKIELGTALDLKSVYSMRFYELFAGQTKSIRYSINNLRIMFGLEKKYSRINDFVKYVLDLAKKELDKKAPHSFNYKLEKKGRKYTTILFTPYYIEKNRDLDLIKKQLLKNQSITWSLSKLTIQYLKEQFLFSEKEIKANINILEQAENNIELLDFLARVKPKAYRAENPKGYLLQSIKNELKNNQKIISEEYKNELKNRISKNSEPTKMIKDLSEILSSTKS